ncbi:MAG: HD domain-containing protein, partial [Candidatus Promineifilaceae bacterium]
MDIEATLNTLLYGIQLKQTARTGWAQRGVPDAESVADHSFGVAFVVVVLARQLAPHLDEPLDLANALAMAVLHDLPEALTSDIPSPAWRLMPKEAKPQAEEEAMRRITGAVDGSERLLVLWHELKEGRTVEARLVHDADKIDLYLQALVYEQQSGNRRLEEFWQKPAAFHFPQAQALYEALR